MNDATADASELLAAYYEAFNRADAEAMLRLLADDVAHDINQGRREIGRDAFRAFLARMGRCYRERLEDVVILVAADGARAAAEFTVHGIYRATDEGLPPASGQPYVLPGGAFFEIRSGVIARVTNYYNLEDWLTQIAA